MSVQKFSINNQFRLEFVETPAAGFLLTSSVLRGEIWTTAVSTPNRLVGGGLNLVLSQVIPGPEQWLIQGSGSAAGMAGQAVPCAWSGKVTQQAGGAWFECTVRLPASLQQSPELVLWLGELSTMMDRQSTTWRRVFIGGPTKNTQGLAGNDLPALYYYDPLQKAETIIVYDASALAWEPKRLLRLRCQELWDYESSPARYGVGLSGSTGPLAAGEYTFRWWLWQGPLESAPTQWEAVEHMIAVAAPILDGQGRQAGNKNWAGAAASACRDLLDPQTAWVESEFDGKKYLGLRAYARGVHQMYAEQDHYFELITLLDVLTPLQLYLKLHPDAATERLTDGLRQSMPVFHDPQACFTHNHFPPGPQYRTCDTWYFFEHGLVRWAWEALLTGNPALKAPFFQALEGARRLAQATNYCFPLFADYRQPGLALPVGPVNNYSVGGMYAYACMLAAQLDPAQDWKGEAHRALDALRHLPVEMMHHEPHQLSAAAAAAALLADHGDTEMGRFASQLISALARQAYWHDDPLALELGYSVRGLFQACASLLYPAMREQSTILPWVILLRRGLGPTELMLKLMNLSRKHSFAFFEPFLKGEQAHMAAPYIPYENLATSELPQLGEIGKEIYGSGETLWHYLLFEALACSSDPEILVVALDLLEPAALANFPPDRRRFIVYNPTGDRCSFSVQALFLPGMPCGARTSGPDGEAEIPLADGRLELELEAHRWIELEVIPL